ncbi:site-specific DNA-methyltransferase [Catalinimonas sp. 4WD22]|uniref:site-specific DNA-methyltransferase n=1 Tax=Catalinimonas locisalis TaxID=3133978 RepID=UPI0031019B22
MSESYKHTADKRAHIPSKEEAGYESASPKVSGGKQQLNVPKNPVVNRGQDPELFWMNKYGVDEQDDRLKVDIRSLYRHEHIPPESLIKGLYRIVEEKKNPDQMDLFSTNELFGNALERDELEKVSDYYTHQDGWSNRMIQGDSLLVMSSLLEREGMAGQVQCIYIDPPYGIKYGSNWQMKLNDRNVKDGSDDHLSGEPEMIKAFRDTWELGIHSYLSYMRDRLLVAKELLTESGSCFVQISDENVHLVRSLMDEVFGSDNFLSLITVRKTLPLGSYGLAGVSDYIIWYGKNKGDNTYKYRQLYDYKTFGNNSPYSMVMDEDGNYRRMTDEEKANPNSIPKKSNVFRLDKLTSSGYTESCFYDFELNGEIIKAQKKSWSTNKSGMKRLIEKGRVIKPKTVPNYIRYFNDFPVKPIHNLWDSFQGASESLYVVQTNRELITRCILMSTDPGDLVLDPTCGSGTTAYVSEQWGRRWITIDTSRIALNIAKTRMMTAVFPYYHLYSDVDVQREEKEGKIKKKVVPKPESEQIGDMRQGFVYEEVPHITLKALANDEPFDTETLYDQPYEDKKKMRVAGPFTVETLQNFEPLPPESLDDTIFENTKESQGDGNFEETVFEHLKSAGVKNGIRNEQAVFVRIDPLSSGYLHAEGFYQADKIEKKAYIHIGPKFGTVSKQAVNEAVKECRQRGDGDWLIILGFSFESDIQNQNVTTSVGSFEVTKVRMNDDLMQEGLMKKDKKAASFVTIGEPDIKLHKKEDSVQLEILGLDIYDPIKDQVKARSRADIAYWMVDDDYDGSNFVVKQVFFCGGDKKEFQKWEKGLSDLARQSTKRNAEKTLKIEIDDEAFDRIYGFQSHPIEVKKEHQRIAVRVISQFGEESTKVMTIK